MCIVVCTKYYIDEVPESSITYKKAFSEFVSVASRHVNYVTIVMQTQHQQRPQFYLSPKVIGSKSVQQTALSIIYIVFQEHTG